MRKKHFTYVVLTVPIAINLEIHVPPMKTPGYLHGELSEETIDELMQDLIH